MVPPTMTSLPESSICLHLQKSEQNKLLCKVPSLRDSLTVTMDRSDPVRSTLLFYLFWISHGVLGFFGGGGLVGCLVSFVLFCFLFVLLARDLEECGPTV